MGEINLFSIHLLKSSDNQEDKVLAKIFKNFAGMP